MLRTPALLPGLALVLVSRLASADPNVCRSTCEPTSGESLSAEEARAVSASFDGILNELRSCLDSVGAASINPAVILRFDANGNLISKRYDLAGYENLACARDLEGQPTSVVIRRSTSLKCESRCSAPPARPASAPAAKEQPAPGVTSTTTMSVSVGHQKVWSSKEKEKSRSEKAWYGYQTLIADGASLAFMVGGAGAGVGKVTGVGVAGYLFATPIVHWAHGNVGQGFASLGLRVVAPTTLGLLGVIAGGGLGSKKGGSFTDFAEGAAIGGGVGFLLGYAGVIALDSAVFAYSRPSQRHHDDDDAAAAPPPKKPAIAWQPSLAIRKTGTTVGIVGTF